MRYLRCGMLLGRSGLKKPKQASFAHITRLVVQPLLGLAPLGMEASFHCVPRGWSERCADQIYRTDHADEFDVSNSVFFSITSSLAPVLRFRRRLKSVYNVLKALRPMGLRTHERMPFGIGG